MLSAVKPQALLAAVGAIVIGVVACLIMLVPTIDGARSHPSEGKPGV
jgi:hypothetical protein